MPLKQSNRDLTDVTFSSPETVRDTSSISSWRTPIILYILSIALPLQVDLGGVIVTSDRLLSLTLIIPLTFGLISGRFGRILLVDILFFLHILWGFIAVAINNPDRVVSFMGSNSIEFLGGYLIARAFVRSKEDLFFTYQFLLGVIVITLPFALYEAFSGVPVLIRTLSSLPGLSSVSIAPTEARMGLERVQVFLPFPIHYGLFAGILFSTVFIGFRGYISDTMRYVLTIVVCLCTFLSLSSGPFLAVFMQLGLILWGWLFRGTQARWLILLGIVIAAYVVIDILSNRTPLRVFLQYATFNAHTAYWRLLTFDYVMQSIWQSPIFGIGLNDWERPVFMRSGSVDNFWLLIGLRYGVPGFLFLAIGYVVAMWSVGRRDLSKNPTLLQIRRAWIFSMAGLAFALSTVHVWGSIYSFVFFFFGTGMWIVYVQPPDKEKIPTSKLKNRMNVAALTNKPGFSPPPTEGILPYSRFPVRSSKSTWTDT